MSQKTFGNDLNWRAAREDLTPSFYGTFSPIGYVQDWCRWADPPRSHLHKGMAQQYGGGVPSMNSMYSKANMGLGTPSAYVTVDTEQGPINLPNENWMPSEYSPSVDRLNILIHSEDTRRLPDPTRYSR